MKNTSFSAFWLLLIVSALIMTACTEDDPLAPFTDPREKFLGTWGVEESCVRSDYQVEITAATGSDSKVLIENF
ncbi:MAG: hypothetical protein ACOCX8_01320, partial [Bacteroidota bacterium]